MFEAKKRAANFSGYKAGHGVLHVNRAYLNANQSKIPSLKQVGSGIGGDFVYTEGSENLSSTHRLNRCFFTPLLRPIAIAMGLNLRGFEYPQGLSCLRQSETPTLIGGFLNLKPKESL